MAQSPFKVFSTSFRSPLPNFEGTKDEVCNWLLGSQIAPRNFEVYCTETETVQDAREFLAEKSLFVPKFYRMNPETDDLLPNSQHLSNGMMVLIESANRRVDTNEELSDWEEDRALENNRWCTVEALEIGSDRVKFIGVYGDGSKRLRRYSLSTAWYVKKDSVRDSADQVADRHSKVYQLVQEAMNKAENGATYPSSSYDSVRIAEETAEQILRLL